MQLAHSFKCSLDALLVDQRNDSCAAALPQFPVPCMRQICISGRCVSDTLAFPIPAHDLDFLSCWRRGFLFVVLEGNGFEFPSTKDGGEDSSEVDRCGVDGHVDYEEASGVGVGGDLWGVGSKVEGVCCWFGK